MKSPLRYYESTDRDHRVEIFRRDNGTFGFQVWRRDGEEGVWITTGRYSVGVFDSEETALREARGRVDWFQPPGYRAVPIAGPLSASQVSRLVHTEIGEDWRHTNAHGCDLRACLVPPELVRFVDPTKGTIEAWLVLREDPAEDEGYGVCFDQQSGTFGLVYYTPAHPPSFIGLYGGFFDAFDAM